MKNKKTMMAVILIVVLAVNACAQQGGKSINSAEELKKYLDSQPANSPDKPIKVAMKLNEPMFPKVRDVINEAGKYVSLDLSGSPITTIPDVAFENWKLLAGIIIPKGVTSIGDQAFYKCANLAKVTIPDSVTSIGGQAFYDCTSLTSVTIPSSVTFIERGAFLGCKSLTSVTFQGTIKESDFEINYEVISVYDPVHGYYTMQSSPIYNDLRDEYLKGGVGTYTTTAPVGDNSKWTKK